MIEVGGETDSEEGEEEGEDRRRQDERQRSPIVGDVKCPKPERSEEAGEEERERRGPADSHLETNRANRRKRPQTWSLSAWFHEMKEEEKLKLVRKIAFQLLRALVSLAFEI